MVLKEDIRMTVYGIVCECNPFHRGHQLIINRAYELGADAVVGLRYGSSQVMDGAAEVLAYGTAVKIVGKK